MSKEAPYNSRITRQDKGTEVNKTLPLYREAYQKRLYPTNRDSGAPPNNQQGKVGNYNMANNS